MPTIPPPSPASVDQMLPSGAGWTVYFERAFAAIPPDRVREVVVDSEDHRFVSVFGFDLFASVSADSLVGAARFAAQQAGKTLYFMKIWHNLFGVLGTGLDVYRVVLITDP